MKQFDQHQLGQEEWHFGRIALRAGLVNKEDLQQAIDAQVELQAAGIQALLGDVMLDLGLLTAEQCEQILTLQDQLLHEAGLVGRVRGAPTVGWLVAGMVPVLSHMSPGGVLAWSGAMLLGVAFPNSTALRWVGFGWLTSVVAPVIGPIAIAGSGSLLNDWRMNVGAALLGPAFMLVPFPATLHQAGPLLLIAAVAMALFSRGR